jgi:hypothetical protein
MEKERKGPQSPNSRTDFAAIWDAVFRGTPPKRVQQAQPEKPIQPVSAQPQSAEQESSGSEVVTLKKDAVSEIPQIPDEPTYGRILIAEIEKGESTKPSRPKQIARKTLTPEEAGEQLDRMYTRIQFYMVAKTIGCALMKVFPMIEGSMTFEILIVFGRDGKITFRGNAIQTTKTYRLKEFIQLYKAYVREDEVDPLVEVCENLGKISWEETLVKLYPLFCIINRLLMNAIKERFRNIGKRLFGQEIIFKEEEEE